MANAPFTRDEVILALDVLYSAGEDNLSPRSELIAGLSELLNLLPIYPKEKRPDNFRNCVGVSHQIERFKEGYSIERKKWNVGTIFFEVDAEYAGRHNELHSIAQSIRRNLSYFNQFPFGGVLEQDGFPEGALLSHLHRLIELRDGQKISLEERCAVCQLEPEIIYKSCGSLLQNHLMIPPAELDGGKKYSAGQFMTLCPNCHAALHRFRPWLQRKLRRIASLREGTYSMYGYEWTEEYGIFRLTVNAKIQKEIRPVFHEELDFFGMDRFWDYPKDTDAPLLWAEGIRRYVMNGVCVAEAIGGAFYTKPEIKRLTEERLQLQPIDTERLYEVNQSLMISLEQKAVNFIQEQHCSFQPKGFEFVCAFSGGKDSLALLDLVAKALAPKEFYVIFSNTGMELSDTLKAVEAAKKYWPDLHFKEAVCHMKATESWDEFGPPGRRMRWCCAVHKSVPTVLKLREITESYNVKIVVFDGVRSEESARRAKYNDVTIGTKNVNQVNASPIKKWNTAELYCYILKNGIMLNRAYRLGLFRVGCMVCPLSSDWWDGIANSYYADEMKPLLQRVEAYAERTKPAKEVKKYIEGGGWKARMGGRGLTQGGNRVTEQIQDNAISFTIQNPTQKWLSVAPVLGPITEQSPEFGIQKIGKINFEYRVSQQDNTLKISYTPFFQMDRFVISHLRGVAYKCAYCKGCKACIVQCPTGAFTIQQDGTILIRQALCSHCSNCLTFTDKSCLIAKSLSITNGDGNMKGLNPYQHFGFRQDWMIHFTNDGIKCFEKGVLGNRQYEALRVWLKESGVIVSNKAKSLSITALGEKILKFGPYNPLAWAVIWANLSYNSTICHWYCLNAEIGATYEKNDLVVMLGENGSKSSRENAITALAETLRQSPIGSALKQGLPIEMSKNTYSYFRAGWDYPHAVAILYALYLYAEHTGRRSFTFTELVNAHNNPDAKGMSPADIYGIDVKVFREAVQGLALRFPDYIRVSFVANLDNIILENFSSLDILDLAED